MTPRLKAWLWCLLLVAVTTIPSDVSASHVDALASVLDKIVPERVRFWRKHVPSEDCGDVDAGDSTVDHAAVVDESDELDKNVDGCSESGTCDIGDLYDGDEGEKHKDHGDVEDECVDNKESCEVWASKGECEKNSAFMIKNCKKSCFVCPITEVDMGVEQIITPGDESTIRKLLEKTEDYLRNVTGKDYETIRLLHLCKNKRAQCAQWAVKGECEANPNYMKLNCAPVCQTCDQLAYSKRCPIVL
jgi:hypothetical protein